MEEKYGYAFGPTSSPLAHLETPDPTDIPVKSGEYEYSASTTLWEVWFLTDTTPLN